jgi:hypothetical protein
MASGSSFRWDACSNRYQQTKQPTNLEKNTGACVCFFFLMLYNLGTFQSLQPCNQIIQHHVELLRIVLNL